MPTAERPASGAWTSTLWILLLTAASVLTTLALACATPFAAFAALAATRLGARDGVLLMIAAWVASQAVGFGLLGYPLDARTVAWGFGLGTAAVASVVAARSIRGPSGTRGAIAETVVAFLVASAAFQLSLLCWALPLGGVSTTLSPTVVVLQLVRGALVLAAIALAHDGLVRVGLPSPRRDRGKSGPAAI